MSYLGFWYMLMGTDPIVEAPIFVPTALPRPLPVVTARIVGGPVRDTWNDARPPNVIGPAPEQPGPRQIPRKPSG